MKRSVQEKFHTDYIFQSEEIKRKIKSTRRKSHYTILLKQLDDSGFSLLSSYDDFINLQELSYKHSCGTIFKSFETCIQHIHCPICSKKYGVSEKEKELLSYIKSIYTGIVIENDRSILTNKELDIYIPEKKLAIEFNGTYWHSLRDIFYHQKKSIECKKNGIRVIHIFEQEWNEVKLKIQSAIQDTLCTCKEITNFTIEKIDRDSYLSFLKEYSLNIPKDSIERYGFFHQNELIAVIGLSNQRIDSYVHKFGYRLVNGLKEFILKNEKKSFFTFIDFSHSDPEEFLSIGFKENGYTEPNLISDKVSLYDCGFIKLYKGEI